MGTPGIAVVPKAEFALAQNGRDLASSLYRVFAAGEPWVGIGDGFLEALFGTGGLCEAARIDGGGRGGGGGFVPENGVDLWRSGLARVRLPGTRTQFIAGPRCSFS